MEEKGVSLTHSVPVYKEVPFDKDKCILCQQVKPITMNCSDKGCKRIKEAANIRDDEVSKRLKLLKVGEIFQYHMTNECYKSYTHKKNARQIT